MKLFGTEAVLPQSGGVWGLWVENVEFWLHAALLGRKRGQEIGLNSEIGEFGVVL